MSDIYNNVFCNRKQHAYTNVNVDMLSDTKTFLITKCYITCNLVFANSDI